MTNDGFQPGPCCCDGEHRLYVVLHGLICLTDIGKPGFVGHILDVQDEHDYLYGNWLREEQIPPRAPGQDPFLMRLVGVNSGCATLDPCQNAILTLSSSPSDNNPSVRAVVYLPRPEKIYYFLSGAVDPAIFSDVNHFIGRKAPDRVSAIRVFQYSFAFCVENGVETNSVALLGRDYTPLWICPDLAEVPVGYDCESVGPCPDESEICGTIKVAVLHIYDEPGSDLDDDEEHNKEEFNLSTDFLGATTVTLLEAAEIDDQDPPDVPGLLDGETDPLSRRDDSVLALLQVARGDEIEPIGGSGGTVCNGVNGQVS